MPRKSDPINPALLIAVLLVVVFGLVGLTPGVMASSVSVTLTSTLKGIPATRSESPLQVTQIAKGGSQLITIDSASQVKQLAVLVWRNDPTVEESPYQLAWSPDSHIIAVAGVSYLRWMSGGNLIQLQNLKQEGVYGLAFSADNAVLAAAGSDSFIHLWDVKTGQLKTSLEGFGTMHVSSLVYSPNGSMLAAADDVGEIRLWDVATGQLAAALQGVTNYSVDKLVFSQDGSLLASYTTEFKIDVWDVKTAHLLTTLQQDEYTHHIMDMHFNPDQSVLFSADFDGRIALWNVKTAQLMDVKQMGNSVMMMPVVAFSPNGSLVAAQSIIDSDTDENAIRLWDVQTGQLKASMHGHGNVMSVLAFSPDSTRLVSGSFDGTVRLWGIPAQSP